MRSSRTPLAVAIVAAVAAIGAGAAVAQSTAADGIVAQATQPSAPSYGPGQGMGPGPRQGEGQGMHSHGGMHHQAGMHKHGHGGRQGDRGAAMWQRLDSDRDGLLSRAEVETPHQRRMQMFDQADANKDGKLSPEEARAFRDSMRAQLGEHRGMRRGPGGAGAPGQGPASPRSQSAPAGSQPGFVSEGV